MFSLLHWCVKVQPLLCLEEEDCFLWSYITALDSPTLVSCWMALDWNGSTLLSGDIVGVPVPGALRDAASECRGCVSRLVSSTCLIYCLAVFEVGRAEFASLVFLVISLPRLQPRWGLSPSTTGYRKYLSLIAPGHTVESGRFPAHGCPVRTEWLIYALTA